MSYDEQRMQDVIEGGLIQQQAQIKEWLEENLVVGAKVKIGAHYSKEHGFKEGEIIELVEGRFESDNGLYTVMETAPSIWNERQDDFDSIYHLFGNDFEYFFDCEIIDKPFNQPTK